MDTTRHAARQRPATRRLTSRHTTESRHRGDTLTSGHLHTYQTIPNQPRKCRFSQGGRMGLKVLLPADDASTQVEKLSVCVRQRLRLPDMATPCSRQPPIGSDRPLRSALRLRRSRDAWARTPRPLAASGRAAPAHPGVPRCARTRALRARSHAAHATCPPPRVIPGVPPLRA
jgi:hypothetical protein